MSAGQLKIERLYITEKYTFIDYLKSGLKINLCVAIDYTISNGESNEPSSHHFLGTYNQYEKAIFSVGSILEVYDHDRSFPVYGFGGIPRFLGATKVDHCFPLNGNISYPEVKGITNLLQLYRSSLPNISMSGPTFFAPIIQQQLNIMEAHKSQQNTYSILLIVTDGDVHDMPETKKLVV